MIPINGIYPTVGSIKVAPSDTTVDGYYYYKNNYGVTRSELQTLMAGSLLDPHGTYCIKDAVSGTLVIGVFSDTTSTIHSGAYQFTTIPNSPGVYDIVADTWTDCCGGGGGSGTVTSVGLSAGTGISIGGTNPVTTSGTISVTNTAPDQTVVLNAGTGIGVSGTYPNFTISNTNAFTSPLTTKGDIYVRNGSADTRLPVGLDTQILIADSTQSTGLKWGSNTTPPASGYYGAFQDNFTQIAALSNTGYPIRFRTTDLSNGVSIVTDGTNLTRITFANTGIYTIHFSAQFQNLDNATQDVTIWLSKNGIDISGSSGYIGLGARKTPTDPYHLTASWAYTLSVVGGDYFQLYWSTTSAANVTMPSYPAGSPPPLTASAMLNVIQQAGIMAGTGITAINSLTGAVQTLASGTSGTDFGISSAGTTHTFNLPTASATKRGALSSADWSTFNNKQNALTTGNLTESTSSILTISGGTGSVIGSGTSIQVKKASTSQDGYLASTDFTTFNNKQNALTNPVTGTGTNNEIAYFNSTGSTIASLPTATYPSLTELSYVKGVTSAIQTQLNTKLSANQTITLSGDVSGSGSTSITTAIGNNKVTNAMLAGSIDLTTKVTGVLPVANGGTNGATTSAARNGLGTNKVIDAYAALGSQTKSYSLGLPINRLINNVNFNLTSGMVQFHALEMMEGGLTLTGVQWVQIQAGVYTANNNNKIGLYSYSGGTLTLVASSTNDGNLWKATGGTLGSKAFSSTYTTVAGTMYFAAIIYSTSAQTTVPQLYGTNAISQAPVFTNDFTNSAKIGSFITGQTDLPATQAMSGLTTNSNFMYLAVY